MLLWKYFAVTVYYRSTFSGSILDILSKPNSISQTALIKKTAELLRKKKKNGSFDVWEEARDQG